MRHFALSLLLGAVLADVLPAQTLAVDDPVLRRIWTLGMEESQAARLIQTLTDSIGPRLTATPQMEAGQDWLVARYREWGIAARKEPYGTWLGWSRGLASVQLLAPRERTLEAHQLAWSGGTGGKPVEATTVILPELADEAAFRAWLPSARGKFVLTSYAEPTCRPDASFQEWATPATWQTFNTARAAARRAWADRVEKIGGPGRGFYRALEEAGVAGVITSRWSLGWGVTKIFNADTRRTPVVDLSCEDYGMVFRLTEHGQSPRLRITSTASFRGEVPVFNVIGEIRGTEKPDEYVVLSAHFDSWDASSGATDNATGTVTMLEAMRILRQAYPNPKRTIVVGHWSGEEQGLIGSRAYAADHPEVVAGLQALWNQDNGTGRIVNVSASGFTNAGEFLARWFARVPSQISTHINFSFPGSPAGGGSDHAAFICHGAPGFGLSSHSWEYGTYTWHTNRDTYDKVVIDELKNNATLVAMLTYLAAEDPERVPRDRRIMPATAQGAPGQWPACPAPARSWAEWGR